jgi:hypothetical protein
MSYQQNEYVGVTSSPGLRVVRTQYDQTLDQKWNPMFRQNIETYDRDWEGVTNYPNNYSRTQADQLYDQKFNPYFKQNIEPFKYPARTSSDEKLNQKFNPYYQQNREDYLQPRRTLAFDDVDNPYSYYVNYPPHVAKPVI